MRLRLDKTLARVALPLAIAATAVTSAPVSYAQTAEELAAARKVFGEGKALEGKGAWAEALEKFKTVATVKTTPQVRFHIALCEENLGRLVAAINGFELAAEEAKLAGSSAAEVEKLAPQRAKALRARIGKLKIGVTGKVIDSKILLDEVPVASKDFGGETMVDPGAHVIEVRDKDGKSTFRKEITVAEKGSEQVEVPVDDKEAPKSVPTAAPPPPPPPSRVPVYIAGSVGAAAFAVSAVFWVLRGNTLSQAIEKGGCKPDYTGCNPGARGKIDELSNQGRTDALLSGIFLGVGAAGVATAAGFLIASFVRKPAPTAPAKSSLTLVPTGTGFQLVGTF
jgi:hypothetical protein